MKLLINIVRPKYLIPVHGELRHLQRPKRRHEKRLGDRRPEQDRHHQAGGEQQKLDEDFLVALEHGMPPAGGMGMGMLAMVVMTAVVNSRTRRR